MLSISRCWVGGRTPSKTLNIRRATSTRSPASSASRVPLVSGRRRCFPLSQARKRAGVEMENRGLQSTIQQGGRVGSGVSASPRPPARAVVPRTQ